MKILICLVAGLLGSVTPLGWAASAGSRVLLDGSPSVAAADKVETLKVHFARTRGVGDFEGFPDLNLDARDLSADDLRQLQKLLDDARFFKLTSSPTPPPQVPDPPAGYDLRVEQGGQKHTIWVTDDDVTPTLKPLVQWLTDRARKPVEKDRAFKIDFTKSGGLAGLNWKTTIDAAKLSTADARELRYLIDEVRFFELPTELLDTQGADLFNYTITIEMDGKRHTVRCYDDTVPEALQPLLRWLAERASD